MVTAIISVHFTNGVWSTANGYEYNLVLIAVAFALAGAGAGAWSLDGALGLGLIGAGWALGALAVGVVGGVGGVLVGRAGHRRAERRHRGRHDRRVGATA